MHEKVYNDAVIHMVSPIESKGGIFYNATDVAGLTRAYRQVAEQFPFPSSPNTIGVPLRENKFSRISAQLWWQTTQVRTSTQLGEVYFPQPFLEGVCDAAATIQTIHMTEIGSGGGQDGTWHWDLHPTHRQEVSRRARQFLPIIEAAVSAKGYFSDIDLRRRELISFALDGLAMERQLDRTVAGQEYLLGADIIRSQWRTLSTEG